MTDSLPESSFLSGYASLPPSDPWTAAADDAPAPLKSPAAAPAPTSAASLASAAQQLLDSMVRKRVPRVDALRRQLLSVDSGPSLEHLDGALGEWQSQAAALDIMAGRAGTHNADRFIAQCTTITKAGQELQALADAFGVHHATQGPVSRLLWIELVLESASMQKRVRQGAHWLAQMDREIHVRRQATTAEVSHRALDELGRRGRALYERLQTVHRLCGHARSVHTLCEQLAVQRTTLGGTLQDKLRPAGERLRDALQPLAQAVAYRALVPEELMAAVEARHAMQVRLAQARAEIAMLQSGHQELVSQLAWIQQKAGRLA